MKSPILTDAQKLWLSALQKMALAYPASRYADLGAEDLLSTARVFADELSGIPAARIPQLYKATMENWVSGFAPSVGDFRAAWHRQLVAAPVETFQQIEAREDAARGFKALMSGELEVPRYAAVHRGVGGVVVCHCTYGEADRGQHEWARNRKFLDDSPVPAVLVETPEGARWRCARGVCDFDGDALCESEVRAMATEPLSGGSVAKALPPMQLPTASATRAEILAEQAELDATQLTGEQWARLGKMARWLDFYKRGVRVTRGNFAALWEEFEGVG